MKSKFKYDTIIFDLDGTLLDTLCDLTASVNYALTRNGMSKRTIDEVRQFLGNGVKKLMLRATALQEKDMKFQKAFDDFKQHYAIHCNDNTKLYDGIEELLMYLKENGIKTAIVSNKADFAVQSLKDIYFRNLVDCAYGEREKDGIKKKPAPDMVKLALDKLNADVQRTVYVGDSDVDIMTAKNSNLPVISVDWGFRDRQFLIDNGATTIVSDEKSFIEAITTD